MSRKRCAVTNMSCSIQYRETSTELELTNADGSCWCNRVDEVDKPDTPLVSPVL